MQLKNKLLFLKLLPFLLPLLFISSLNAKQLFFRKEGFSYQYQWLQNSTKQKHSLEFTLNPNSFKFSKFINYHPQNSRRFIEKKLKLYIQTYDPKAVQFRISRGERFALEVSSSDNRLLSQIQKDFYRIEREAQLEYLKKHYYQYFTDSFGSTLIKPDHRRIVKASLAGLLPISDEFAKIAKGRQQRDLLELILSFIQSIPYDRLLSKDGLRGAGYAPPVQLIDANKGDCDSKAALMLSLLKNIYPETAMVLIFVPEHAFIGLNVAATPSDNTIVLEGVVYLVADPTGPSQLALGRISKKSAHYLSRGLLKYELFNKL